MLLKNVIEGLNILDIKGNENIDITGIEYDSRNVTEDSLFVCIKGFKSDGHKYIETAMKKGAKAFLVEDDIDVDIDIDGCTFVKVEDTRADMARISDNFYEHPSRKLGVIGVTGTNGKTSITTFLEEILIRANKKLGLIGTIKIFDGDKEIISSRTTPESPDLQHYFDTMLKNGCDHCAMEVSSHSLALNRVLATEFELGIFTNLTPDHLDFHKDMDDYREAKEKLFHMTTKANIINIDDEGGRKIYENIKGLKTPCYTYGVDNKADFMARDIKSDAEGVSYRLVTPTFEEVIFVPVPGMFTVYNTLAVIAACYELGIDKSVYKEGLRLTGGVSGRFETVPNDREMSVIVDYAHTPDALENVLKTGREFVKGRLISVFGCGGDRDSEKRPLMGEIGQKYSDICFITSDNPRTEEPNAIIADILGGVDVDKKNYHVVVDREEAIKEAIEMGEKGDVILIAGKGHEDYQVIGETKHHFDDKEVALRYM
ncbi:MAG: UDP-N-acetylmuramoyl-L-alanyl-D-glutamate--2,6-diaminopimelate ligase [Clostridioides sp.]|jgi:UDP-N-acetylmuramoyl-L-alanyl-D-glutamate--2,6-diaminopimelate ligase|nr:UDP-N-acetylmuramoyl-L-alanyl-D-glutamate--2,6-diaminopimelate ligase [Clostridioides sp.]